MTAAPQALEGTEREAYVSWLADTYPSSWSREAAEHNWQHNHISALAWQARAALAAPAPQSVPEWPCTCEERGIGVAGVSCGDCPRDYGHKVKAPPAKPIDVEAMIRECLPGGHSCDPQAVADSIREWVKREAPHVQRPQTKEPTNDR